MCDSAKIFRARAILALLLLLPGFLHAQNNGASLEGHILDPQGKAVVNADVTLRNTLSGAALTVQTTGIGGYSFPDIAPGEYIVIASAAGLATQARSLQLKPGEAEHAADIALPLATVEQDITVVSASRVEELQQDSPLPIDLVTRQRIERTGFESVSDVLSELPGIVTRNNASYSGSSQEQIDGVASQDVLVLQDGLPIVGARGINSGIETFVYTNVDQPYTQGVNLKGSVLLSHNLRVDGVYGYLDPYDVTEQTTLTERSRNQGYVRTEYVSNRLGIVANIRGNFFGRYLITTGEHEQAYALWNF